MTPTGSGTVLSIRPQFATTTSAQQNAPINRIVITARITGTSEVVGTLDRVVDPSLSQWELPLDLTIGQGVAREVTIAIELMHTEGTSQTVEWSGIATVSVAAGEQKQIANVVVYPGPLAPIASIALSPANAAVPVGQALTLRADARDAQNNALQRLFTWASSDTSKATVSSTGVVVGKAAGVVTITVRAENKSATTQLTVYVPGAASIGKAGGDGQSAPVSTALAAPLQVRVFDQQGSPIAGTTIQWVVTAGGGSVAPASSTTDASGMAQTRVTVGPNIAVQTIEARAPGLTGSPVVFNATSIPQLPVTRITVSPATRTLTAGDTATFVATAADTTGNTLRDVVFTWSSSDTTVARVDVNGRVTARLSGSATIFARSNNRVGTAALTVVAGAASRIGLWSGNNQVAPPARQLASDIAVRVVDRGDNPIANVDVTFNVIGGGGTVATRIVKSDVNGLASTQWTLGPQPGPNTVEAVATGLQGSPVVFTATASAPLGVRRTWIGGNAGGPTNWSIASNWNPAVVPSDIDTVFVPAANASSPTTWPRLTSNAVVGMLIVQAGATVSNGGYDLAVRGSVDVAGAVVEVGSVTMTGANAFVRGAISGLIIVGSVTANGAVNTLDRFIVNGGSFTVNGQTITAAGDFAASSGTITMTNPADLLIVGGRASFGNINETGKLTNGTMRFAGDLVNACYNNTELVTSGTRIVMNGTAAQQITLCSDANGNQLFDLTIAAGARVTTTQGLFINTTLTVAGTLTVNQGAVTDVAGPARSVIVQTGGFLHNLGTIKANLPIQNSGTFLGNPIIQR